jgi:hypothetical protein
VTPGYGAGSLIPPRTIPFMYFTDRGIEELVERRGEESVSLEWVASQLQVFVDQNPEFETAIERFATFLARGEDDED